MHAKKLQFMPTNGRAKIAFNQLQIIIIIETVFSLSFSLIHTHTVADKGRGLQGMYLGRHPWGRQN